MESIKFYQGQEDIVVVEKKSTTNRYFGSNTLGHYCN